MNSRVAQNVFTTMINGTWKEMNDRNFLSYQISLKYQVSQKLFQVGIFT